MSCADRQARIDAHLDGELEVLASMEMEAHLKACPACAQVYANHQALREALSGAALSYRAPVALRRRIRAALPSRGESEAARPWMLGRWLGLAAAMAVAIILAVVLIPARRGPSIDDLLAQEVVSSHIRSLMGAHLTDVPSSDQHTVKPWFDGKLDFAPPVRDLAGQGYPLVGGRLDYLNGRPVAALIYQRRQHFINLFIWPAQAGVSDALARAAPRQGYNLLHWAQGGMVFWAVSDVNPDDLGEFSSWVKSTPR